MLTKTNFDVIYKPGWLRWSEYFFFTWDKILLKLGENINEVETRNSKVVKDNFTLQKQAEEVNS